MSGTAEHPETRSAPGAIPDAFRMLAESAPVGMLHANIEGDAIFVNARWRETTGITDPTPIPFQVLHALVHPDDHDGLLGQYTDALTSQASFETDVRLTRPDGQLRYLHIQGEPYCVDGEVVGFIAATTDTTPFVEANAAREASERRYHDLMAKAPVGQTVFSLDGHVLEVNQAGATMLGYEVAEVIGLHADVMLTDEDQRNMVSRLTAVVSGEIPSFEVEHQMRHRDGHLIWVTNNITVAVDGDGRPTDIHALTIEITKRKEAEAQLRGSEERATTVIQALHEGLLICTTTDVLLANESAGRILGVPPEDLVGPFDALRRMPAFDADGNPSAPGDEPAQVTLMTGEPMYDITRAIEIRPDELRWCLVNTVPLFAKGEADPYAVVISFTDITESKKTIDALRVSENRFRTLTESLPVGVYQTDARGQVIYVNPQLEDVVSKGAQPLTYAEAVAPIHPDDQPRVTKGLRALLDEGGHFHDQYRVVGRDGTVRWMSNRGTATVDENGEIDGLIGSVEDVTALLAAQEQNARLAGIIESTSDLVGITDVETGHLVYMNRAARETFGLVDADLSTVPSLSLYTVDNEPVYQRSILPTLKRGEEWSGELTMRNAAGEELLVWQTITPVLLPDGTVHQVSTLGRDVTERRRFEADLAHQATHDSLTGLPNRALLLDHLELALARAERDHRLVSLLFLDLDRFKSVNDNLGHDAGDELLAQAARLLSTVVRPSDTVARLGGDEFVILCDDVEDQDYAEAVARRVAAAIEARPFLVGGSEVMISASIGIALSSGGQAHPEALLRDADAAMYRAKDLGRARLEIYDESMRRRTARRLELADELAEAIESGDIQVHFQPGVDLETGQVRCVEALARWEHPVNGLLWPGEFISLAEETGLIVGLGLRVLSTACEHGRRWEERFGDDAPRVHVNLSARQLTTSNLPVLVQGVLEGSGLTPSRLCLEITESVLMDDASAVIDTLWELKKIGVTLAIDDFGTGYSSLSYLRRFPVDVLKIDQSFVAGLGPDPEDSTIVAAIVNLASTLDLEAIAEGVETVEQMHRLRDLGCRLAQGYYFAEPAEAAKVATMITQPFKV